MAHKYNPFRPDKMAGPGMFAGRFEELEVIDHSLLQTKKGNPQHFIVQGERGLGKSSLFLCSNFVGSGQITTIRSNETVNFIVINVSLSAQDDYLSLIKKITSGLKAEVAKRHALTAMALGAWDFITRFEAGGVRYNRDAHSGEQSELLAHLQADFVKILSNLDGVADGIFLLIDEADKAGSDANLGLVCKLLTEELARKRCDRLCIGIAGLPNLLEVLRESHESSPRIFKIMGLNPLEESERIEVLDAGMKEATKEIGRPITMTADAKELISALSEGYPHFLQEFAHCAYEEDGDDIIDRNDVANSLHRENGAFDQLGRKYFDQFYTAPDSDDYRQVLNIMADHLDSWVNRATIIHESGLKGSTVDNALRALKSKNVILNSEMKRGDYRIPTMSFAVWIKARNTAKNPVIMAKKKKKKTGKKA